jgi:hypothetical protein
MDDPPPHSTPPRSRPPPSPLRSRTHTIDTVKTAVTVALAHVSPSFTDLDVCLSLCGNARTVVTLTLESSAQHIAPGRLVTHDGRSLTSTFSTLITLGAGRGRTRAELPLLALQACTWPSKPPAFSADPFSEHVHGPPLRMQNETPSLATSLPAGGRPCRHLLLSQSFLLIYNGFLPSHITARHSPHGVSARRRAWAAASKRGRSSCACYLRWLPCWERRCLQSAWSHSRG